MTKTKDAPRKSSTHFEQIPLDVVKKIAAADVSTEAKAGTNHVIGESASRTSRPGNGSARSFRRKRR